MKPKVYLALGISGAPEHIEGMKSAAMVADLFEVCEELTEAIEDR